MAAQATSDKSGDQVIYPPMVTAIMVIGDSRRAKLAARAINQFGSQSYLSKELVIVNAGGKRITNRNHPIVREIEVDRVQYPTVGALRNFGLSQAQGEWCMPWDDDDHSHPHRIVIQMAHRREGHAVLLTHQVRMDTQLTSPETHTVCVWNEPDGIPGTILFPRQLIDDQGQVFSPAYDDAITGAGEDVLFAKQFRRVLAFNGADLFPGPMLHIAFWHGLNIKSRSDFLGQFAGSDWYQRRDEAIVGDRLDYLVHVVRQYGLAVNEEQRIPTEDQPVS